MIVDSGSRSCGYPDILPIQVFTSTVHIYIWWTMYSRKYTNKYTYSIEGTSGLEGAGSLEVFTLKVDLHAGHVVDGLGGEDGGAVDMRP